jgi:hypothetical protein
VAIPEVDALALRSHPFTIAQVEAVDVSNAVLWWPPTRLAMSPAPPRSSTPARRLR